MKWYIESGNEGDVVISSRIRLARNIQGYPFANKMSDDQCKDVLQKCKEAAKPLSLKYLSMEAMPAVKRQMLVERHVISPEMLNNTSRRAVLLSDDEQISIMLNEEDHIRIQCMSAGLELEKMLDLANNADDILEEKLDYGFSTQYGYATCCPTNTGTGLRASCMLHLPALTANGYIDTLLSSVGKLGLTVRGVYGEGTRAKGSMYQISNQITLGMSEQESLNRLKELVKMVIEKERIMRASIMKENEIKLADMVWRSFGILANAQLLTSDEAYKLLSVVRLGISVGITTEIPKENIIELTVTTGVAHIFDLCDNNTTDNRVFLRA